MPTDSFISCQALPQEGNKKTLKTFICKAKPLVLARSQVIKTVNYLCNNERSREETVLLSKKRLSRISSDRETVNFASQINKLNAASW